MTVNIRGESLPAKLLFASVFPFYVVGKWVDANVRSYRSDAHAWIDKQLKKLGKAFLGILAFSVLPLVVKGYGREVLEIIGGVIIVLAVLSACRRIFSRYEKPSQREVAEVQELLERMARATSSREARNDLPVTTRSEFMKRINPFHIVRPTNR